MHLVLEPTYDHLMSVTSTFSSFFPFFLASFKLAGDKLCFKSKQLSLFSHGSALNQCGSTFQFVETFRKHLL